MNELDMATLNMVRKEVGALPQFQRQEVEQAAAKIRAVLVGHGPLGFMALALVDAEVQAGQLQA